MLRASPSRMLEFKVSETFGLFARFSLSLTASASPRKPTRNSLCLFPTAGSGYVGADHPERVRELWTVGSLRLHPVFPGSNCQVFAWVLLISHPFGTQAYSARKLFRVVAFSVRTQQNHASTRVAQLFCIVLRTLGLSSPA